MVSQELTSGLFLESPDNYLRAAVTAKNTIMLNSTDIRHMV